MQFNVPNPETSPNVAFRRRGRMGILIAAAAVVLLLLAPYLVPTSIIFVLNDLVIGMLFAASLNLIMGYGRMISFGHAAYYAIGAYGVALMVTNLHWPTLLVLILAPIGAAAGAAIIGFFCVRSSGAYFIMLTLAFAQLLYTIIYQWYSLTHGDDGLSGIYLKGWLGSPSGIYQFSVLLVAAGLVVLWLLIRSPFGYAVRATGINARRAEFLGISERRLRYFAFVIAGFFAGMAGMLFALFNGSVAPSIAYWTESAQPFMAVIIGGMSSFFGPLIGSVLLSLVSNEVAIYTKYSDFWVGILALAVGLFLRGGLAGIKRRRERMR